MATEVKTASIIPLNGNNFPTWKIQCRMALVKEGLWGIVKGTETVPEGEGHSSQDRRSQRTQMFVHFTGTT